MYNEKNIHHDTIDYFFGCGKVHISNSNILRWNFFRSPHLHVPGGLSVTRDYNPEWSVVTGLCAVWNVYWLVDLLAWLIQYIWNPKFILISMDYNYDNLIQYSAIFKNELMNSTGHPPFLAESFQQLKEKILHKELPPPKVKGIDGWYSIISTVYVI